jgi:hypothetical protein
MSKITLTVTDEDGTVLDSMKLERKEFRQAQNSGMHARAILDYLAVGADEGGE